MNYSNLSLSERETLAYMSGDSTTADLLARLDDTQTAIEGLEEKLSDVENDVESFKKWEKRNGPVSDYYDFFHECFARLDGRYPCPSVTNETDKAVIFEAIENGERVQELEEEISILKEELRLAGLELRRYGV